MSQCDKCKHMESCEPINRDGKEDCIDFQPKDIASAAILFHEMNKPQPYGNDPVKSPTHYVGKIECIDYLRDKLTPEEFTGFCMGNVLKYSSLWRKKDGVQDLKKAKVYLEWAIENEEKQA